MPLISPLTIQKIDATIPLVIYSKNGISITITPFDLKEKEGYFGITGLQIDGEKIKVKFFNSMRGSRLFLDNQKYLLAKHKITISSQKENIKPVILQDVMGTVDFVFKIIFGVGFPSYQLRIEKGSMKSTGFIQSNKEIVSRRNITKLTTGDVLRIKRLLSLLLTKKLSPRVLGKISLLKFMLMEAMSLVPNLGLSGSLYISILESIFVPKKESEITYRFAMRFTRRKKESLEYMKKIKKLYGKRSAMYHSGSNKFSVEDLIFVEIEATEAIEKYIIDPDSFTAEALDKDLLAFK